VAGQESQLNDIAGPRGWVIGEQIVPRRADGPPHKIVYSDLDGTLLHPVSYSYTPALTALRQLQEAQIPVVFCSAKTRAEIEELRRELGVKGPFIVESGGAIYIPKNYFRIPFTYTRTSQDFLVIELGAPYSEIKQRLKLAAENSRCRFATFGELSVEEVAQLSGLNLKMAQLAKEREYSETVVMQGDKRETEIALAAIRHEGLHYVFGGRFYEVSMGTDKGKAVKILNELFKLDYGRILTYGLGDGQNDLPMLEMVDQPMLVQNSGRHWSNIRVKNLTRVRGIGPDGWSQAVSERILKIN
jgi:mannosyl-3-phosphoglycerate synthase